MYISEDSTTCNLSTLRCPSHLKQGSWASLCNLKEIRMSTETLITPHASEAVSYLKTGILTWNILTLLLLSAILTLHLGNLLSHACPALLLLKLRLCKRKLRLNWKSAINKKRWRSSAQKLRHQHRGLWKKTVVPIKQLLRKRNSTREKSFLKRGKRQPSNALW